MDIYICKSIFLCIYMLMKTQMLQPVTQLSRGPLLFTAHADQSGKRDLEPKTGDYGEAIQQPIIDGHRDLIFSGVYKAHATFELAPNFAWVTSEAKRPHSEAKAGQSPKVRSLTDLLSFFLPFFLPSFLPSFISFLLSLFLSLRHSFFLSFFLSSFLPSLISLFLYSFLPSFLPSFMSLLLSLFLSLLNSFFLSLFLSFFRSFLLFFFRSFFLSSFLPSFLP